jgi:hypothetical protein
MAGSWRRRAGRARPGLSLIELLVGIAMLGTAGALLMPRLVAREAPPPCCAAQDGYIGIGARLDMETTWDGYVRVDGPLAETPAERAGLQADDVIMRVDDVPVQNEPIDGVRHQIMNGPIDSTVNLMVRRNGEPVEMTIRRAWIPMPAPVYWTGD